MDSSLPSFCAVQVLASHIKDEKGKKAREALNKEWKRLIDQKTWDFNGVMEFDQLRAQLNKKNETNHLLLYSGIHIRRTFQT